MFPLFNMTKYNKNKTLKRYINSVSERVTSFASLRGLSITNIHTAAESILSPVDACTAGNSHKTHSDVTNPLPFHWFTEIFHKSPKLKLNLLTITSTNHLYNTNDRQTLRVYSRLHTQCRNKSQL
jgi:hypothetical protein